MDARTLVRNTLAAAGAAKTVSIPDSDITDPVQWIEKNFFIPEVDGPIVLMPYHRAVLREAYRTDERGLFVYSTVLWGDIKKSAKSSIAAAVGLERARRRKWAMVKIIANDLKQAQSRVSFYLQRAIEMNPALREIIKTDKNFTRLPNHAIIEALPIDPKGEAGGNDDLIIFSELWGADSTAAKLMWSEMTLSPTKYGISQRFIETYAGFSGEAETLEQLWHQGVKEGRLLDVGIRHADGSPLELYVNDAARLLCLWNTKPLCPWQTSEYYAQEESILLPTEFLRMHRNQWGSSTEKFVPDEWWMACNTPNVPPPDQFLEVTVGIDAAVSNDCFGIVAVSRHGQKVVPRYVRKWTPPKGGKIEYSNPEDPDDVEYPEGALRWLAKTYNVIVFGYDETQLHHLCTSLVSDGVGFFKVFGQGIPRLSADKQLHDVIRDRLIAYNSTTMNIADLTEHIKNSNKEIDPHEHKLRIIKRSQNAKIDLAVSLSMATDLAYKFLPE